MSSSSSKSIAEQISKMNIDEVRKLISFHVNQANNNNNRADSIKWISALITSNMMRTLRDPSFHESLFLLKPLKNVSSYHWKLLKLKGRLDTITERMIKRKSGTLEPYTTYMDEDSTDKIDKFLLMSQVKPLESDDDDMDLNKII
ncbi:uncharacterized protein LOC112692571 [Sipha flava]|uniref:Uncharacterized protein LOC112692571 n=1 Tax=Sipha flava TaxID=143950 RepID=A0A8B8GKV8_9HEMI|nr:uncharacterized protein LOC112692571 [Sipha flava]